MPAARYWKIHAVETFDGGDLVLGELRLADSTGTPIDSGALLTSSLPVSEGSMSDLRDGDLATQATFQIAEVRTPGFAFVWDFGVGGAADVAALVVGMGASTRGAPYRVSLSYSDDGASWVAEASGVLPKSIAPFSATAHLFDKVYLKTRLLLAGRGTNGAQTVIDESPEQNETTALSNVQVSTVQSRFGGSSLLFSSGEALYPASALWQFGTGDFTVDTWVYLSTGGAFQTLGGQWANAFDGGWSLHVVDTNAPAFLFRSTTTDYALVSSENIVVGSWNHVRACRQGANLYLFLNGVLRGSRSDVAAQVIGNSAPMRLGRSVNVSDYFNGFLDEFRVIKGIALSTASFPLPNTSSVPEKPAVRGSQVGQLDIFADDPPPGPVGTTQVSTLQSVRDMYFGGNGFIAGTINEKGTPTNVPLRRRVRLLRDRDSLLVAETWSDKTTGAYRFDGIDQAERYTTVSYDYLHNYRAVIADNITPEIMS